MTKVFIEEFFNVNIKFSFLLCFEFLINCDRCIMVACLVVRCGAFLQ